MLKLFSAGVEDPFYFGMNIDSSNLVKVANEKDLPKEVDEAIENLERKPNHRYALLSAMGSGETWGSNRNADFFPENYLLGTQDSNDHINKERGPVPRYKTFENGNFFHHHKNKPHRGDKVYGYIPAAISNPKMHTILLIIGVDATKDPETAEQIDRDLLTSFSMGARLPWDECSICGNRASKRSSYCEHLKKTPNQILADGRKAFAYNYYPDFFDISKVFRPAFEGGRFLLKVASDTLGTTLSADLADEYLLDLEDSHTNVELEKKIKSLLDKFPAHIIDAIHKVSKQERFISPELLKQIASYDWADIWSGFATAGIVPTPAEFAFICLTKIGRTDLADHFINKNIKFNEMVSTDSIDPSLFNMVTVKNASNTDRVAELFTPDHIKARSISSLNDRIYTACKLSEPENTYDTAEIGKLLTTLYFELRENLANYMLSHEKNAVSAASIVLPGAAMVAPYVYAAHVQNQQMMGQMPGILGNTVANNAGKIAVVGGLTAAFPHEVKKLGKAIIGKK